MRKRKWLSLLLSVAMVITMLPTVVLAEGEEGVTDGLCPHHTVHTGDCSYEPAMEGQSCTHEHTAECMSTQIVCVHTHTAECYPDGVLPGEGEEIPPICGHTCIEEDGCVTSVLTCTHVHDTECGYLAPEAGSPCVYVCSICPVQALIDALPESDSITEDSAAEVGAKLDEIDAAKLSLTDDELDALDFTKYDAAIAKLNEMEGKAGEEQPVVLDTATNVSYLDASGVTQTCTSATKVTADATNWTTGWYVVQGTVTANSRITVSGEIHLILADGCTLIVNGGIQVDGSNALTIYGQTAGTGKLIAQNVSGPHAGIGGTGDNSLSGGTVTASGGTITINGGNITATGGLDNAFNGLGGSGAGIGSGAKRNGGTVIINGGKVTANGGGGYFGSAGIGGGSGGSGGNIEINGGTVTTTGGSTSYGGAGIGGGCGFSTGGTITIRGGTVIATGGSGATGIGGGGGTGIGGTSGSSGGDGGNVTISGGIVTANGLNGAAGIGGGRFSDNGGTFKTADSGNAIIKANKIADQSGKNDSSWRGVIFEGSSGKVYGDQTLTTELTISSNETLTIPNGTILTVPVDASLCSIGAIYVDGTLSGTVTNSGRGAVYYPLTVNGGSASGATFVRDDKTYGKAGETVTLTGTNIPVGQAIGGWTTSDSAVTIADNKFTMPAKALIVNAQNINAPTYTVTIPATVQLGNTATISAEGVNVVSGSSLVVTLTDARGFKLTTDEGAELSYSVTQNGTEVSTSGTVLTVAGGNANASGSTSLGFALNDTVRYSGNYTGILTFSVSVEVNTVSFKINGVSYQAPEGTVLYQWCNTNNIHAGWKIWDFKLGESIVSNTDVIVAGAEYTYVNNAA